MPALAPLANDQAPDATKPLYDYLEHPSTYRANEFAAMFQRAATNQ